MAAVRMSFFFEWVSVIAIQRVLLFRITIILINYILFRALVQKVPVKIHTTTHHVLNTLFNAYFKIKIAYFFIIGLIVKDFVHIRLILINLEPFYLEFTSSLNLLRSNTFQCSLIKLQNGVFFIVYYSFLHVFLHLFSVIWFFQHVV